MVGMKRATRKGVSILIDWVETYTQHTHIHIHINDERSNSFFHNNTDFSKASDCLTYLQKCTMSYSADSFIHYHSLMTTADCLLHHKCRYVVCCLSGERETAPRSRKDGSDGKNAVRNLFFPFPLRRYGYPAGPVKAVSCLICCIL